MTIFADYTYETRCVLLMRYKLGLSYEHISDIMKLPVDRVKGSICKQNKESLIA